MTYWPVVPVPPDPEVPLPDDEPDEPEIVPGIYVASSAETFEKIVRGAAEDLPVRYRIYKGCAGWGPGQLDREMQDNAWLVVDGDAGLVFDPDFAAKWQRALDRLSGGGLKGRFDPASFSHQTGRA